MTLQIADANRVRRLTLDRPDALNAFNEALYDATAEALLAAAVLGAGLIFGPGSSPEPTRSGTATTRPTQEPGDPTPTPRPATRSIQTAWRRWGKP